MSEHPTSLEQRAQSGDRLFSPSAGRNRDHIAAVLAERLPQDAVVQEIGSGTGEHGATVCALRRDIVWRPSDPDARSRASQAQWARDHAGRMTDPAEIDASQPGWHEAVEPFDALVSINVVHISPFAVAENLAAAAAARLKPGGLVYFYGPFQEGAATAPSNLEFDASLKARNPAWGVRHLGEIIALFEASAFTLAERIEMPANNLSLIFRSTDQ